MSMQHAIANNNDTTSYTKRPDFECLSADDLRFLVMIYANSAGSIPFVIAIQVLLYMLLQFCFSVYSTLLASKHAKSAQTLKV